MFHQEREGYFIYTHFGKITQKTEKLNYQKYYNDEILKCKSNLMVIPFIYYSDKDDSHLTMLVIEKVENGPGKEPRINVDHFDSSHYTTYKNVKFKSNGENPAKFLIETLFTISSGDYEFNGPEDVCSDIQNHVFLEGSKYEGSCSMLAALYGFKRLLEPQKTKKQIENEMFAFFNSKETSEQAMIKLIETFQSLVNLNFEKNNNGEYDFKVGDRKFQKPFSKMINDETQQQRQAETEAEAEKQRQAEAEQQKLAEIEAEQQRQAEAEQQRLAEIDAEQKKQAEAEKQKQAEIEAEEQRQAEIEAEQQRQAEIEAEQQRQAEIEAEQQRQAEIEAEQQRQAEIEAEQKKQAEIEAEKQRQAEIEAEQQRQAEIEAEQQRQATEAEQKKQAEIEAEQQRQAEIEAEQQRQAEIEAEQKAAEQSKIKTPEELEAEKETLAKVCENNLLQKNENITEEEANRICRILNNLSIVPPNRDNIKQMFEDVLDLWFMDSSILEEIFKKIKSKDLCFLHKISFKVDSAKYFLFTSTGKDNRKSPDLDFQKYFKDEISRCESNLMVIPFHYYMNENPGHLTMLVIERVEKGPGEKTIIKVDHFDSSHYSLIINQELKTKQSAVDPVKDLVQNLFIPSSSYDFEFNGPEDVCIDIQNQVFTDESKYQGSCTMFSALYAFKRLLEPEKPKTQIQDEMLAFFNTKDTSEQAMIQLIKTFQSLVQLNFKRKHNGEYDFMVNDRSFFEKISNLVNNATKQQRVDEITQRNRELRRKNILKTLNEKQARIAEGNLIVENYRKQLAEKEKQEMLKIVRNNKTEDPEKLVGNNKTMKKEDPENLARKTARITLKNEKIAEFKKKAELEKEKAEQDRIIKDKEKKENIKMEEEDEKIRKDIKTERNREIRRMIQISRGDNIDSSIVKPLAEAESIVSTENPEVAASAAEIPPKTKESKQETQSRVAEKMKNLSKLTSDEMKLLIPGNEMFAKLKIPKITPDRIYPVKFIKKGTNGINFRFSVLQEKINPVDNVDKIVLNDYYKNSNIDTSKNPHIVMPNNDDSKIEDGKGILYKETKETKGGKTKRKRSTRKKSSKKNNRKTRVKKNV
jgi:acyl transferase domain-containing protein